MQGKISDISDTRQEIKFEIDDKQKYQMEGYIDENIPNTIIIIYEMEKYLRVPFYDPSIYYPFAFYMKVFPTGYYYQINVWGYVYCYETGGPTIWGSTRRTYMYLDTDPRVQVKFSFDLNYHLIDNNHTRYKLENAKLEIKRN